MRAVWVPGGRARVRRAAAFVAAARASTTRRGRSHMPAARTSVRRALAGTEGQLPRPVPLPGGREGVSLGVTPRQACPRPKASGATCVQRLDGSRDSAIHTKYRISLRSSSMREPRYPLPRVFRSLSFPEDSPVRGGTRGSAPASVRVFLGAGPRRGLVRHPAVRGSAAGVGDSAGAGGPPRRRSVTCARVVPVKGASTMILPQVHLRKPCYDFSFL